MNKYVILLLYIKEWKLPLAFEHYFLGSGFNFLSQKKLQELQRKLMYKKINTINKEFKNVIKDLNEKYQRNSTFEKNETIWQYWDNDPKPKVVNLCMKSLSELCSYRRIVLNDENILNYYVPSEIIDQKVKKGYITKTHFSDILRVNLLYKYGGAWLDSTIFITKEPKELFNYEFWTIKRKQSCIPSKGMWTGYAIATTKNNKLMYYLSNLFNIYWQKHKTMIDYFLIDIFIYILYCEDKEIKQMIDKVALNNEHCIELENFLNSNIDDIPNNLSNTSIFKLNWKLPKQEENNGEKTLFRKLLDEYEMD